MERTAPTTEPAQLPVVGIHPSTTAGPAPDVRRVLRMAGCQLVPAHLRPQLAGLLPGPEPGGSLGWEGADPVHRCDVGVRNGRRRAECHAGLQRLLRWGAPIPQLPDIDAQPDRDLLIGSGPSPGRSVVHPMRRRAVTFI